jgi:aminopeptidase-like protein
MKKNELTANIRIKKELCDLIDHYLKRLFHINRCITGKGNRESLRILQEIAPIQIKEYPSGSNVYDWVIPDEWIAKDAWIKDANGEKLIDFQKNNLHLISYSIPVQEQISFSTLEKKLHYLEELPKAIPYRTSYYKKDWGFCVTKSQYQILKNSKEPFEVLIDTKFSPNGSLSVGEVLIPGRNKKEILVSTYICHPSLANDNLSGVVLTAFLAKNLIKKKLNLSYRFIFVPETIGAISYCANNEQSMKDIDTGLVITCVGGPGEYSYKQSLNSKHYINSLTEEVFREGGINFSTYPFDIHGSDERQYSSQRFRINTTTICKDKYYEYDYYHTSLDDLNFVSAKNIGQSLTLYIKLIDKLEGVVIFKSLVQNCEVMLSKHGLYPELGGSILPNQDSQKELNLILWLIFYCDGHMPIDQISKKISKPIKDIYKVALILEKKNILKRIC